MDPNRNFILNENLHGFFNNSLNENYYKPRRSSRISKKIEGTQNCDSVITSQYYCKGLNSQKSDQLREESNKNPPKGNCIVRNNSKSLFRKINERCARAKAKNSNNFNYPISTVANSNSKVERFCPSTFSLNLSREICVDLNQSDYLLNTRLAIKKKIRDVNDRLVGKMNTGHTTPKRNEQVKDGGDQNDFHYVPKCNWVYETPPRQKVVLPRVEKCAIQPAVICTAKKQSNIYELHQTVNVDLSEYINRQNVEVDRRYMRRVASFDEKVEADLGFHVDNVVGSHHMDMGDAGCSFLGDQRVEEEVSSFSIVCIVFSTCVSVFKFIVLLVACLM